MRVVPLHDLGGHGAPLLICHATGFNGNTYEPLAALLAPHFRVYALDLLGHGAHPHAPGPGFSLFDLADDVRGAAADIPGRPLLFGHSMGGAAGMVAQAQAEARGEPGPFRALYLYEPAIFAVDFDPEMPERRAALDGVLRRRERFGSRGEALARFASRPPFAALNAGCVAAYVEHGFVDEPDGAVRLRCARETERAYYERSGEITLAHVLHVRAPVTLAVGEREAGTNAGFATQLARELAAGTLVRFAALGHLGPLEHPASVARSVIEHLRPHGE